MIAQMEQDGIMKVKVPAIRPAFAHRSPVGRVLLDDLVQSGLGVDGGGVDLFLAVGVVADFAVVALARLGEVLAQLCLVVWPVLGLRGQLLAHLLGQLDGTYLGFLTQLVSPVCVL